MCQKNLHNQWIQFEKAYQKGNIVVVVPDESRVGVCVNAVAGKDFRAHRLQKIRLWQYRKLY